MNKNIGSTDKSIRVSIAVLLAILYFFNIIEGTLSYVLMAFAIILLVTSFINFCPLYVLLKINSCKTKK